MPHLVNPAFSRIFCMMTLSECVSALRLGMRCPHHSMQASATPCGREPVDSPVWPVCQPSALLYHLICRVFSCDEAECSGDFSVCCLADETVPGGDFGFNQFFRRVSFCPLSGIPVRCHELSCMLIYVHQGLEVIMACGSYVKMCLLFHCFGVSCGLCPFFLSAQS